MQPNTNPMQPRLTELEIAIKTCSHELKKLTDLGFAGEDGWYCSKCGEQVRKVTDI